MSGHDGWVDPTGREQDRIESIRASLDDCKRYYAAWCREDDEGQERIVAEILDGEAFPGDDVKQAVIDSLHLDMLRRGLAAEMLAEKEREDAREYLDELNEYRTTP